jgi:autotransporter-associated beta strand protein
MVLACASICICRSTRAAADSVDALKGTPVTTTGAGYVDLSASANYSSTISPTAATTVDVNFAAATTYTDTTFDANGAALSFGSLDDLNATALTLTNTSGTAATLQLNLGSTNATSGSNPADLLYVASTASLSINSGSAGGLTLLLANTGNIDNAGLLSISAPVSITGGKTITFTGAGATSVSGSFANTTGAVTIANAGGTVTFTGTNLYTGATTVNGGTLTLDFSGSSAPATNIISSSSALTLGGGTLNLNGKSGATNTQAFNGTTFTGNTSSALSFTQNGATSLGATLGGLTRNTASTVDIALPTTGTVSTTSTTFVSNSVLVSAATNGIAFGTSGGTTWLTNSSGTLGALSTYATGTANYIATNNVDVTSGDSVSGVTVNTLRFNAANDALTLAGTNVVSTGGILATATGAGSTISGGTLTSGGGKELVIIDNGSLNVGSVIANNTGGASALTLAGTGTTTLSGANTFTGNTSINAGTTKLGVSQVGTASGALGTGAGTVSVATGATLDLSTYNLTVANVSALGGTITSSAPAGTGGTLTDTGSTNNGNTLFSGSLAIVSIRPNDNTSDLQITNVNNNFSGGLTIEGTNSGGTVGTIGAANFNPTGGLQSTTTVNSVRANAGSTATLGSLGIGTITLENGQAHWNGGYTIANAIAVTANGGILHTDGGTLNLANTVSGTGYLVLSNGFTSSTAFSGSLSGFTGTLGIDTNNVGSVSLNGSATGNASMEVGFFGTSTANGNLQWNGTGSPTIQIGEIFTGSTAGGGTGTSTTTAGLKGSTTAATTVTYQIGDSTANTPVFTGVIANGSGNATTSVTAVTKVGTDNQTFSGVNTYTGATLVSSGTLTLGVANTLAKTSGITVNSGTLMLAAANALATPVATTSMTTGSPVSVAGQVPITLGGGTLMRNGTGVSLGTQSGTAGTVGLGTLTLTAPSNLNYGTTGVGTLNFNGFSDAGSYLLSISSYTSTYSSTTTPGAGTDGTDDRLVFNQNMATYLTDFSFNGQTPTQLALGNGEYELIATVPEPSAWMCAALGLGVIGFCVYRRRLAPSAS